VNRSHILPRGAIVIILNWIRERIPQHALALPYLEVVRLGVESGIAHGGFGCGFIRLHPIAEHVEQLRGIQRQVEGAGVASLRNRDGSVRVRGDGSTSSLYATSHGSSVGDEIPPFEVPPVALEGPRTRPQFISYIGGALGVEIEPR